RWDKEIPSPRRHHKWPVGSDLGRLQLRSEQMAATSAILCRRVLPDDHVMPTRPARSRAVVDPSRLEEFKLVFDGCLDAQEEQAAIAVEGIRTLFAVLICQALAKRDSHP